MMVTLLVDNRPRGVSTVMNSKPELGVPSASTVNVNVSGLSTDVHGTSYSLGPTSLPFVTSAETVVPAGMG